MLVFLYPSFQAYQLLRNSLFFAFSKPLHMLACLFLHVVPVAATYMFLKYLPLWSFLWMLIGFSGVTYLSTHVMLRQFLPFLPEVDICGDIIPPEMEGDPNLMVADGEDASENPDEKTLAEMQKYGL